MTAKVVGKNSSFCFGVKNSFEHASMHLDKKLLLLNLPSRFFHLVPFFQEFGLKEKKDRKKKIKEKEKKKLFKKETPTSTPSLRLSDKQRNKWALI